MSDPTHQQNLPPALQALGLSLSARAQGLLLAHLSLIAKWNRVYNLTAVRDPAEMFTHHLLDSLAAVPPLVRYLNGRRGECLGGRPNEGSSRPLDMNAEGQTGLHGPKGVAGEGSGDVRGSGDAYHVLDVGAGAGLPGVALAIALPEALGAQTPGAVQVTCVDAVAKKAGFIRQVAAELGLSNLQAVHGRIEALSLKPADVITCRAFASLADIVQLTRKHLAPGGVWMALKGAVPQDEIDALPDQVEVFHVEPLKVPQLEAQRCLVWMRLRSPVEGEAS